jgi:hypothetical protein
MSSARISKKLSPLAAAPQQMNGLDSRYKLYIALETDERKQSSNNYLDTRKNTLYKILSGKCA